MLRKEIVGALVDFHRVTTDFPEIDRLLSHGANVHLISRESALNAASRSEGEPPGSLASAPTLFLLENGVRYLPIGSCS